MRRLKEIIKNNVSILNIAPRNATLFRKNAIHNNEVPCSRMNCKGLFEYVKTGENTQVSLCESPAVRLRKASKCDWTNVSKAFSRSNSQSR